MTSTHKKSNTSGMLSCTSMGSVAQGRSRIVFRLGCPPAEECACIRMERSAMAAPAHRGKWRSIVNALAKLGERHGEGPTCPWHLLIGMQERQAPPPRVRGRLAREAVVTRLCHLRNAFPLGM